ncbi:MAG: pentapeptide repeat-containing protein, partial [Cyanobacteria bacterium J06555_13]
DQTSGISLDLSLIVISTVLASVLIWLGYQLKKISRPLGVVTAITTLVLLAVGLSLFASGWGISSIAEMISLAWLVPAAIVLVISIIVFIVLAGASSLSGSAIGVLIVLAAITLQFMMRLVYFQPDSIWLRVIMIADISVTLGVIAWATILTIAVAINLTWAEANNNAIALVWSFFGITPSIIGGVMLALWTIPWLPALKITREHFLIAFLSGATMTATVTMLGTYIGWRALNKHPQFLSIRELAISFAANWGTSFYGADLTDANFTEATLKGADFRGANLTKTRWFHTQKLGSACVEDSYLQSPQVRQLAVTGLGKTQKFDHLSLKGINLQDINLADASFIGSRLQQANLQNANLSRAKLIGTQLGEANLFGACLTGAYIKDVKITDKTNLSGIECQYIFTQLPTRERPDPGRIPTDHRQTFKPGEFIKFMRKL